MGRLSPNLEATLLYEYSVGIGGLPRRVAGVRLLDERAFLGVGDSGQACGPLYHDGVTVLQCPTCKGRQPGAVGHMALEDRR